MLALQNHSIVGHLLGKARLHETLKHLKHLCWNCIEASQQCETLSTVTPAGQLDYHTPR